MNWQDSLGDDGFATVPDVLACEDVSRLLTEFSRADLLRGRAGVRHAMKLPYVAAIARDQRLVGMAQKALGSEAIPFRATLFDKSATANWLVVWHQDTALPLRERREAAGWGPWSVKDGLHYAHAPTRVLSQVVVTTCASR